MSQKTMVKAKNLVAFYKSLEYDIKGSRINGKCTIYATNGRKVVNIVTFDYSEMTSIS